jgi:iron complex outermembrane receptor protein
MPDRVPPFGIRVDFPTRSNTVGGRAYVSFRRGAWQSKIGGDVYRLSQDADRSIFRRDTGALVFQDIVWPDATLTNGGGYGQLIYQLARVRIGGTVRADVFRAAAGPVSDFFRSHTTDSLGSTDSAVSAALNASVQASSRWTLTLGAGRAVRPPDALERYSDRFPAAHFQIAAEFLGDPSLKPEQSLEFNAGSILQLPTATLRADVFYRTIDDYITVMPDPTLTRRLPLSPPTVYRYINGTEARFTGYEASATSQAGSYVGLRASLSYLWAEDVLFHEPAFGITPFQQRYGIELHTRDKTRWAQLGATVTSAQDRVAAARLEQPTPGWTTFDLRGGTPLVHGLELRAGLNNLTNAAYSEHLNALNPFTGARVLEVGRNAYVGVDYAF